MLIREIVEKAREGNQQCQFHNPNSPMYVCPRRIGKDKYANQCVMCRSITCGIHFEPLTRLCKACVSRKIHLTPEYDKRCNQLEQLEKEVLSND
jgi:hypothetical protein